MWLLSHSHHVPGPLRDDSRLRPVNGHKAGADTHTLFPPGRSGFVACCGRMKWSRAGMAVLRKRAGRCDDEKNLECCGVWGEGGKAGEGTSEGRRTNPGRGSYRGFVWLL